jgi:hypothetical protein
VPLRPMVTEPTTFSLISLSIFKLLYLGGLGNYVVTMIETLKMCFGVVNTFMQKDQNKFEVLYLMI